MAQKRVLISIVMPSYNSQDYILKSIQSVLSQTYTNWELIIADDCSTDNTKQQLMQLSDPRIKVIFLTENIGAGLCRNKAIEQAKGQFIAFLDSDDIWLPNKLQKQLKFMERYSNCAISYTSYDCIDENDQTLSGGVTAAKELNLDSYMQTTGIGLSTAMINLNIVGSIRFSSLRLRQDARLWIELLIQNFLALGIQEVLVHYRKRSGQISGNKLKAAYRTFRLYWSFKQLGFFKRLFNYCCYAYNGVKKRY